MASQTQTETQPQVQPQAQAQPQIQTKPQAQSQPQAASAQKSGYSAAEVAAHDSASSCWSIINGKVYDLTNWIYQHPGGASAILSLCGSDGSAAFNAQHGASGRPGQVLQTFLIGNYIK
jgi:cytochrome b involved in lipid metabolism